MSIPAIHYGNGSTTYQSELDDLFALATFINQERIEFRYCPNCDLEGDHVVIDDVVESAECVTCGYVHDWNV